MFSRVQVKDPGDTELPRGIVIEMSEAREANAIAKDAGGKEAKLIPLSLVSLTLHFHAHRSSLQLLSNTQIRFLLMRQYVERKMIFVV